MRKETKYKSPFFWFVISYGLPKFLSEWEKTNEDELKLNVLLTAFKRKRNLDRQK